MDVDFPSIDARRGRHESHLGLKPHHFYTGGSYVLASAHGRHEKEARIKPFGPLRMNPISAQARIRRYERMGDDPAASFAESILSDPLTLHTAHEDAVMAEFFKQGYP